MGRAHLQRRHVRLPAPSRIYAPRRLERAVAAEPARGVTTSWTWS